MFGKNRNKKVGLCVMVVTSCFILAALWAVLAAPETALGVKPVKPPAEEPVLFDVTSEGDMLIVGTAEGRYDGVGGGGSQVVVNRPPVAMEIAFPNEMVDFEGYGAPYIGTLVIQQKKGVAHAIYFFKGPCKNWVDGDKLTGYRIDADADIVGINFPKEGNYTVHLDNIELSVDTGSRKNGHEGSFPGAEAIVQLVRK